MITLYLLINKAFIKGTLLGKNTLPKQLRNNLKRVSTNSLSILLAIHNPSNPPLREIITDNGNWSLLGKSKITKPIESAKSYLVKYEIISWMSEPRLNLLCLILRKTCATCVKHLPFNQPHWYHNLYHQWL